MLSVSVEVPGEAPYHLQPRLSGASILPSKIEVRLAKADEQVTWTSLEYTSKANNKLAATTTTTTTKKVDWDKLEAEVKEEEEVVDGDAVVNRFFQQMYGNGDEDMRRAMMKPYVESNDTVLSTDWKDVGSKKIEASAPEGMEWEYR
uniref:SGS domain-containing protein n=1 Tax=Oryza meridionalis TaxID=40149 RepID=A0A0E0C2V0_9ORYZ